MGGPMMGFALHTPQAPVIKTTNCIIAATAEDMAAPQPVMPCIHCGACAEVCPVELLPQQLYWLASVHDFEHAEKNDLFDCIECGCCAYVCPSNIPLVHYYRFAKTEMAAIEREHGRSNIARFRFESRAGRLQREQAEREAKLEKRRQALEGGKSVSRHDAQQAAIVDAVERARQDRQQRREEAAPTEKETD